MLQEALKDIDWDMFRASASDVNEFTDVAVSFVSMLVEEIIPTVTIRTFPNQKPWVDRSIRAAVNARSATYNSGLSTGDMSGYKVVSYGVRRTVRDAKRQYQERLESQFHQGDTRSMWQGLHTITDYKTKDTEMINADSAFANELNEFFARFEVSLGASANHSLTTEDGDVISEERTFSIAESDIRVALKRVDTRKAAGPDGITGRLLRCCADQLAVTPKHVLCGPVRDKKLTLPVSEVFKKTYLMLVHVTGLLLEREPVRQRSESRRVKGTYANLVPPGHAIYRSDAGKSGNERFTILHQFLCISLV
ncbi:hypothetical protein QQF64_033749 [Cirrhinus molitorella]|uniref:Uncharacterized protein n=1 Tax=Cirrhinus molitorella TaxID=172907 RepID=A0ABR3MUV2_9TELE